MSRLLTAAAVLVVALPASSVAAGRGDSRSPTSGERAGIARAAKAPARCLAISVSESDERWAGYVFDLPRKGACRTAWKASGAGEAATFVRRSGSRWKRVATEGGCDRPSRVPRDVWRDLGPMCG